MGLRNNLFLTLQLSACLTVTLSQNLNVCSEPGWFGSNCQYKCRCERTSCDRDGVCADGVCESGWFGPGCQYQDLVFSYAKSAVLNWLYDGNNNTCNTDLRLQEINVHLILAFPFTWLRLQVNDPSLLHEFQVMFSNSSNQARTECKSMRSATVNERTLDVHCDLDVTAQFVILKGEGVKSLCSLYISGGRNVALRQMTMQSSTWTWEGNDTGLDKNAVDGNTSGYFYDKSCAHTDPIDENPTWNVTLSREQLINRYVLYNRIDHKRKFIPQRLQGFTLTSFTKQQQVVYSYRDMDTEFRDVYMLSKPPGNASVLQVTIRAASDILTLCEVELYGDSVCQKSKYGRQCNKRCNCANNEEPCFVSTGGCPSGCSAGFQGESCDQPCGLGKYGPGCNSTCSQFCKNNITSVSVCHQSCLYGCQSGYQGSMSSELRDQETYGQNCHFTCNQLCSIINSGSQCDPFNGTCLHGCQKGYQGMKCEQICGAGTFGEECQSNCSQSCRATANSASSCHHAIGACLHGCQRGIKEPDFQNMINHADSTFVAKVTAPVIVVILIVGAIIGVLIWRRKRPKTNKNVKASFIYDKIVEFEHINNEQADSPYEVIRPDTDSSPGKFIKQTVVLKQCTENITSQKQPKDETYCNVVSILH